MTLKHAFVSAIADDAAALAAGEVVPQTHWNADHTVSGTSLQVQYNNAGSLTGMGGTSWDNTNQALVIAAIANPAAATLTLTGGTAQTTNKSILSITQTWNAGGVAFDAPLFMNITNTASAAGSTLFDFQVGGTSLLILQPNTNAIMSLGDGTTATALRIYNTVDTLSGPTNYERGVFDFTTAANVLTIGTQKGGTGSARDINILSAQNLIAQATGGEAVLKRDTNHARLRLGTNNSDIYFSPDQSNDVFGLAFAYGNNIALAANYNLVWTSATNNANTSAVDSGLNRVAAKVIAFNDGAANVNGWLQWAGQARVTSDFSVTSSIVLVNVTGLSVAVQAGRTYQFQTELYITNAAGQGGVQAAIAGTATATAIQYVGFAIADNAIKAKTNATALATAVASTLPSESTGAIVRITGTITVNAAGTLTVQMAQNTSNATPTIAKRGSWLLVHDLP